MIRLKCRQNFYFLCFNHVKWWVCRHAECQPCCHMHPRGPLPTWLLPHFFSSGRFIVAGMLETGHYHELLELIIQAKRRMQSPIPAFLSILRSCSRKLTLLWCLFWTMFSEHKRLFKNLNSSDLCSYYGEFLSLRAADRVLNDAFLCLLNSDAR